MVFGTSCVRPGLDSLFIFCIEEFFAKQEWHNKAPYLFSRVGLFGVKGRVVDGRKKILFSVFCLPNESGISDWSFSVKSKSHREIMLTIVYSLCAVGKLTDYTSYMCSSILRGTWSLDVKRPIENFRFLGKNANI